MRKLIFILLFIISTIQVYSQCTYSICLEDSYGDGWNGNSIDVNVNGTLIYDDLTLDDGSGPECHNLTVNTGENITVTFNATGNWTSECDFYLYDSNGNLVASGDDSNDISETGNCPDCTWQICLGDTYGDGWSGNSIDVIVNGITQYNDLTLDDGYGPECYNISVNYGETIQVTADNSGSYSNECYFYFYDGNGDRIVYTFINDAPVSYTVNTNNCATAKINGDCGQNMTVCDDEDINTSSVGHGNYWELSSSNDGCLGGENFSTWIYFHAETAGQIGFSITPNNEDGGANDDDYDFAVWETTTCPPSTSPIRCSWAVAGDQSTYSGCNDRDIGYVTGIGTSNMLDAVDNTEGQCGDGWVDYINASAGQEYLMVIDNYSSTTNSFTLTWDLPGTASLDCNALPVEYASMDYDCSLQELKWQTLSEINNNYFTIETGKSFDINGNLIIDNIYVIGGSGTTNTISNYSYFLNVSGLYVRLSQVDYDGIITELETKYFSCEDNVKSTIRLMPNPASANSIVNIDGEYTKAEVYNMLGKKVNVEINNNQIIGLLKGFYFVKFDDNKPIKLIIQ